MAGALTTTYSASGSTSEASLDEISLPYETELKSYVKADPVLFDEWLAKAKALMDGLQTLSLTASTLLTVPTNFNSDGHTWNFLNGLTSIVSGIYTTPTAILSDMLRATLKLDPSLFSDNYTLELKALLTTYASGSGTGLSADAETAIFNRARTRILYDASRTARRITYDIAKRLPYAGLIADKLTEADQDAIWATADVNNKIVEEQAKLTYQSAMDRIKTAIEFEQTMIKKWDDDEKRYMQALTSNDEMQLKRHSIYLDEAKLVFENRRAAIQAAGELDGLKEKHNASFLDRKVKVYTTYDELNMKNNYQYYDYMIKRGLEYTKMAIEMIQLVSKGADQITFENYLAMSKLMADGQLRISSLMASLLPQGSA